MVAILDNNIHKWLTTDTDLKLWALYQQEYDPVYKNDDPNIYMWVRRFELFLTEFSAKHYLEIMLGMPIIWEQHELFNELWLGNDKRGRKWLLEPVPIHTLYINVDNKDETIRKIRSTS